jgi:DNA-binding MarR family transcriptional regulator/GNAT superfamily N-acetyltransferase
MTDTNEQDAAVAAVRRFNRFYTRQTGLLDEKLVKSDFTLTEARVLYDLAQQSAPQTLTHLARDLLIDLGYLSRILKAFDARGLIERSAVPDDGRQSLFALTEAGRAAFRPLDRASQREIADVIGSLTPADSGRIVQCMQTIERLLTRSAPSTAPVGLRSYRLGDLGWIARRQGLLYAQEYGWDETYEALAAEILAGFVKQHDARCERGWIAERDGETVGSVFLMRGSDTVAKLRLLYVEPTARGLGLGRQLVDACIGFARQTGYRTLTLWTNDVLVPARRIYHAAGFVRVAAEPHHSFGKDLMGETWDLPLSPVSVE